ncbi:MAG TPA: cellulase family glycosylhydrolase [Cyclobacteriaceae bacterium]
MLQLLYKGRTPSCLFITFIFILTSILFIQPLSAQKATQKKVADVYVDKNGIMHWGDTHEEVHAFGENYTVPFAYAYRAAKELNINIEKAIDDDVYHFARLGFDAFRVHVWDCEISDTLGNLLSNEHLRLFDYTIMKLKERGIKFIITPIAYWGNGYPMPDEKTPGFSRKYGKDACLVNPEVIKAQENYLRQFVSHVNQYTGIAYKDEHDVVAFEVCNEPHHTEAPEKVTGFINRMVKSIRDAGCKKPVLYNISHKVHLADAYFKSNIQGGTFQWYPTGLGFGEELTGNILPNVDKYSIPFAKNAGFQKIAKVVYEFDAADVGRSYIYPAMARSFRTAGIQVATHFAYDPTFTAYANTEYGTHYMNLPYAPQKALSLKIASEVFHTMPLYKDYGQYPANTSFDDFRISYKDDLAELVSEKKFFYTNNTSSTLPASEKLEQIAGTGNSSIVKYEGTGAYFLDRLESGVWRLEVMPDAIWVNDPYSKTSLKKEVSVINWRSWPMTITLPDLGEGFLITPLNDGNTTVPTVNDKTFSVTPGTYLVVKRGTEKKQTQDPYNNINIKEFSAPLTTLKKTYVLHHPLRELAEGANHIITAIIATVNKPEQVELILYGRGWKPHVISMNHKTGYVYEAELPTDVIKEGLLRYFITVKEKDNVHTYPSGVDGKPGDWDFTSNEAYEIRVLSKNSPVYLFDVAQNAQGIMRNWIPASMIVPMADPSKQQLDLPLDKLYEADVENHNALAIHDYTLRYSFGHKLDGRLSDMLNAKKIVFKGRSLRGKPEKIQVALVMRNGTAFGSEIMIDSVLHDYVIALTNLKRVPLVTLPRPYPSFLPYYFKNDQVTDALDLRDVEGIQISVGPGLEKDELYQPHHIGIESVRLE